MKIVVIVAIHKKERQKTGQALLQGSSNVWFARVNVWAVARYALLTVAGILLYKAGAAYALQERGYYAVGGEVLALLLPVLYCVAAAIIRDIVREPEGGR